MRIFPLLALCFCLSACVSSGKFKRTSLDYQATVDALTEENTTLHDTTRQQRLYLERAWGANQALLATQDKLLDRLARQEDELDALSGNLTTTSTKLTAELNAARERVTELTASRDSLRDNLADQIDKFENGLTKAVGVMDTVIHGEIDAEHYRMVVSGGEARISFRENVLFAPRSVSKLTRDAEIVLRGLMDALQADPLLKLTIVGHTDNKPNPRRGTSNWQYGSLRATRLAEELAQTYYLSPNRVVAATHGEFAPIASNSTEEGREQNRRIDFVLSNNVANLLRELKKL